jgi:hypothetical protein
MFVCFTFVSSVTNLIYSKQHVLLQKIFKIATEYQKSLKIIFMNIPINVIVTLSKLFSANFYETASKFAKLVQTNKAFKE